MNRSYRSIILFFTVLFLFGLSALPLFAQGQSRPPANPETASHFTFASFNEAYSVGVAASKEKRWLDALKAFNAALPLAVTDRDKGYTEKWIKYVNHQIGMSPSPLPAPMPEKTTENLAPVPPNGPKETPPPQFRKWWMKLIAGYDYSFLGDLNNSSKGYVNNFQVYNPPPSDTANSQTGNSGLKAGFEFGFNLDSDNALSIELENVFTQNIGWSQAFNGKIDQSLTLAPQLMSASLNYYRVLFRQKWGKTTLSAGAGYYHTAIGMTNYDVNYVGGPTVTGTFTGDVLGGTLGLGQVINLGDSFGLEFSVKGRLATFNQLSADSLTPSINSFPAPYRLVVVNSSNFFGGGPPGFSSATDYLLYASQKWMDLNPGYFRLAVVDYSGISGDISFSFYF